VAALNRLQAHIADVEAKLRDWDVNVDALKGEARRDLAGGVPGAQAELRLLEDLRGQHKVLRILLRALRIAVEDRWDGSDAAGRSGLTMFDEDFVMDELRRAPD
jgi:hypothetical protein